MLDILEQLKKLQAENKKMQEEINLLKLSLARAKKKCACYINNLKMCEKTPE